MFTCNGTEEGFGNPFQTCKAEPSRRKKVGDYLYHYDLLIGSGTYSHVYQGFSLQSNKAVAVKVIDLQMIKQKNLLNLLYQQTQLLAQLNHPNVIKCFALMKSQNRCYIITELCKKDNLQTLIEKTKNKKLPISEVERIIFDVSQGLQYLAQKTIIHRDLKTANILFSQSGKAKIADFGFATYGINEFKDNVFVGTPLYMSPQAILQQKYSAKTDIWSFGVIVYELIFGFAPLNTCKNQNQLLARIVKPMQIPEGQKISDDLYELLDGCLQPNSINRWSIEKLSKCAFIQNIKKKYYIKSNTFQSLSIQRSTGSTTYESTASISKGIAASQNKNTTPIKTNGIKTHHTQIKLSHHPNHPKSQNLNEKSHLKSYMSLELQKDNSLHHQPSKPIQITIGRQSLPANTHYATISNPVPRRLASNYSLNHNNGESGILIERASFGGFQTTNISSRSPLLKQYERIKAGQNHTVHNSSNMSINVPPTMHPIIIQQQNSIVGTPQNNKIIRHLSLNQTNNLTTIKQFGPHNPIALKKVQLNREPTTTTTRLQIQRRSQMLPLQRPLKTCTNQNYSLVKGKVLTYKQIVSLIHYSRLLNKVLQFPKYHNRYLKQWMLFLIEDLKQNVQIHTFKQSHANSLRNVLDGYYKQYNSQAENKRLAVIGNNKQFIPQIKSVVKILRSLLETDEQNKDRSLEKQLLSCLLEESQKLDQCVITSNFENYSKQTKCELYLDWFNNKDNKNQMSKTKLLIKDIGINK